MKAIVVIPSKEYENNEQLLVDLIASRFNHCIVYAQVTNMHIGSDTIIENVTVPNEYPFVTGEYTDE